MSLRISITQIAELGKEAGPQELFWLEVPEVPEAAEGAGSSYVDRLEENTLAIGWEVMRQLMVARWQERDAACVAAYQQEAGVERVRLEGQEGLKVASRLGIVELPRQVCYHVEQGTHTMPGNQVLPAHAGQVTTRGLKEWACLLPQDLPFGSTQRLLGWQTREPEVLSETQVRRVVQEEGVRIRAAEEAEAQALAERAEVAELAPVLVAAETPRRAAAWPAELSAVVEAALAEEGPPPEGIHPADWERVKEARREEQDRAVEELARLGPEIGAQEVVASADEVLVRQPAKRHWLEHRTARVQTAQGYRYVSGQGESFVLKLGVLLLLCGAGNKVVTLVGDGARWLRNFFTEKLAALPGAQMIWDWYHLKKKCTELTSMICPGRKARGQLLGPLLRFLWRGQVAEALTWLEAYRPQARSEPRLDELLDLLRDRAPYIPDYRARRQARQFNGSGRAEKANDLLVARRQKKQGMHWSAATSDGLVALRTLMLNQGWDLYWQKGQVLPLAA